MRSFFNRTFQNFLDASRGQANRERSNDWIIAELQVAVAARALAASGDVRATLPTHLSRPPLDPRKVRIGCMGNMVNNWYTLVKSLRQLGYDAELVIQPDFIDQHPQGRPFWEDVAFECDDFSQSVIHERMWKEEPFVHVVPYDSDLLSRHSTVSSIRDTQALYFQHFGVELPVDLALLLGRMMGHWPMIQFAKRYDVLLLGWGAIALGPFMPVPYAIFPGGGDLFITPFRETLLGLLTRAGYARSSRIIRGAPYFQSYLDQLGVRHKHVYHPLPFDTDIYHPGDESDLRTTWQAQVGGDIFVMSVCRQDWEWKANDKLIRAFARVGMPGMRLVLADWGVDRDASRKLVAELDLDDKVLWIKLGSRPVVRSRQRAADIVVDQFAMPAFGLSVIESMALGKPVIMNFDPPEIGVDGFEPPPVVQARTMDDIAAALRSLAGGEERRRIGEMSMQWVAKYRCYKTIGHSFVAELVGMTTDVAP